MSADTSFADTSFADTSFADTSSAVNITLPSWLVEAEQAYAPSARVDDQVRFVLDLVDASIGSDGGPFAAAVFTEDGQLVAAGVNRVVADNAPIAHAEIVAIAAAGQRLGTWDLRSVGRHRLVSSTEPCAMCLGAVPWAGVTGLVVAAGDADARAAGFDEGVKPIGWPGDLAKRDIEVIVDVQRERAAAQLLAYAGNGGVIYNGSPSDGALSE